jgi:hypothetical protein
LEDVLSIAVMRGLDPRIHVFLWSEDVDGRDKPGHDADIFFPGGT